ncbi:MAG: phosphatidylserine decarboxylase [Oceanospirillaceae bacterium]|nr:phosphatidylserine decarboxylase [Oceanospirillaceae bacterium]
MKEQLFILLQKILPQHLISRIVGAFAQSTHPVIKNQFISWFVARYNVDMSQAKEEDPSSYESFNAFFTRALKDDARPIDVNSGLVFPADGAISQLGDINKGRIFQAKGRDFSLSAILGGDSRLVDKFENGRFATIYLSPRDYHRVHMPISGKLIETIYIPGDLYSVNQTTAENIDGLFARNERLVVIFDTEAGPMAMILVGAMIVAGIETPWGGQVCPIGKALQKQHYSASSKEDIFIEKGQEMGRFKLGSTVVLLFAEDAINWKEHLFPQMPTVLGEAMADQNTVKDPL